jgi:hypothetical protein
MFISNYPNMPKHLINMEQLEMKYIKGVTVKIIYSRSSFTCFVDIISWWMDMRDSKGSHPNSAFEQALEAKNLA